MTDVARPGLGPSDEPTAPSGERSALQSVKPTYVYQQVANELARYIAANNLQPGDVLPSERELTTQLAASRPSVREALRMLELVGLVQTRQGGRTVVGTFDFKFLAEWLGRAIPRTEENMRGLLVVRDVLEVRATELAAEHISGHACEELAENLRRTEAKIARGEEALDEDIKFHDIIFRSCGNAILQRLTDVISGMLIDLRQELFSGAGGGERMLGHHRRIAEALVAHDPDRAAAAMRAHMAGVAALANELLGHE